MRIRDKICSVFDIEVFINCFHCTLYNTETHEITKFEISERKNESHALCKYFMENDFCIV